MDNLIFDAMDTPSFRGSVEVSGGTDGAEEQRGLHSDAMDQSIELPRTCVVGWEQGRPVYSWSRGAADYLTIVVGDTGLVV